MASLTDGFSTAWDCCKTLIEQKHSIESSGASIGEALQFYEYGIGAQVNQAK